MSSKNVIILGAGSSASYGFPTGDQLKSIILNDGLIISKDLIIHELREEYEDLTRFNDYYKSCISFYLDKIDKKFNKENFKKEFKVAGSNTIDTFLSSKYRSPQEIQFGKYIVSAIISYYEDMDRIEMDHEDNWIDYYFNRNISFRINDFFDNIPKVISFNYDSFFENKIIQHLKKEHGIHDPRAKLNQKKFITHVYGKLNNKDYKQTNQEVLSKVGAYQDTTIDFDTIYNNSKNINFIRGKVQDIHELASTSNIHQIVSEADNIYILGYGFDMYNNQILFKDDQILEDRSRNIMYTTYGLEEGLINKLNYFEAIKEMATTKEEKCLKFLKRTMPHQLFP